MTVYKLSRVANDLKQKMLSSNREVFTGAQAIECLDMKHRDGLAVLRSLISQKFICLHDHSKIRLLDTDLLEVELEFYVARASVVHIVHAGQVQGGDEGDVSITEEPIPPPIIQLPSGVLTQFTPCYCHMSHMTTQTVCYSYVCRLESRDNPISPVSVTFEVDTTTLSRMKNAIFGHSAKSLTITTSTSSLTQGPPREPSPSLGLKPFLGGLSTSALSLLTSGSRSRSSSSANTSIRSPPVEVLWASTVPESVLANLLPLERKRQEILFELINTEKEYVDDIMMLKRIYAEPLSRFDIIPKARRKEFTENVFGNVEALIRINELLLQGLKMRQDQDHVIAQISDIFKTWVANLEPYVDYGANQALAKHLLDNELKSNAALKLFCESNERRPECRRLPLQSFLGRPTTRMGRYPLMLEALLSKTSPLEGKDHAELPAIIETIKNTLSQINVKAGETANTLRLRMLAESLDNSAGDLANPLYVVGMLEKNRMLIRDGILKTRSGVELIDLDVILLDNFLLLTRKKEDVDSVHRRIFKKIIPIMLLQLSDSTQETSAFDSGPPSAGASRRSSVKTVNTPTTVRDGAATSATTVRSFSLSAAPDLSLLNKQSSHSISLSMLGRDGFTITLVASSHADKKQWMDHLGAAIWVAQESAPLFQFESLLGDMGESIPPPSFLVSNTIHCSLVYDDNVVLGTEQGVIIGKPNQISTFIKILETPKVTQLEILAEHSIILILHDKTLSSFPLDMVSSKRSMASAFKGGKRLGTGVAYFKCGSQYDKEYVIVIKSKILSTYIKIFEHVGTEEAKKKSKVFGAFSHRLNSANYDTEFQLFKEVYVPSESLSIHLLKTKLCIGCIRGFELVDVLSLTTQALIDSADNSLNFIAAQSMVNPLGMFRISTDEFLLCYQEFGVYVHSDGTSARPELDSAHIIWSGTPTSFSYDPPYVLAFEPYFLEVRMCETGELVQVLTYSHGKCTLSSDTVIHVSDSHQETMPPPAAQSPTVIHAPVSSASFKKAKQNNGDIPARLRATTFEDTSNTPSPTSTVTDPGKGESLEVCHLYELKRCPDRIASTDADPNASPTTVSNNAQIRKNSLGGLAQDEMLKSRTKFTSSLNDLVEINPDSDAVSSPPPTEFDADKDLPPVPGVP